MHEIAVPEILPAVPALTQAHSDAQLIEIWLHGRPPHTQRAYAADIARFCAAARKPLPSITLADLQSFADSLDRDSITTTGRYLHARPNDSSSRFLAVYRSAGC